MNQFHHRIAWRLRLWTALVSMIAPVLNWSAGAGEDPAPAAKSRISFTENFAGNPLQNGWRLHGDPSLFQWNSTDASMGVIWDSRKPNSYFARALGNILSRADDFSIEFEFEIHELEVGLTPDKPFTFQLALGLLNWEQATRADFKRGTAVNSPNLVEFDYFPDSGFGATVSPVMISSNRQFAVSFNFPLVMERAGRFKVVMDYSGSNGILKTVMTRNGLDFGPVKQVVLGSSFTDFRVDTFSISSFSDSGADGSILARGTVHKIAWTIPEPPAMRLALETKTSNGVATVVFDSAPGWMHQLERSTDATHWKEAGGLVAGVSGRLFLTDSDPSSHGALYRVRSLRP